MARTLLAHLQTSSRAATVSQVSFAAALAGAVVGALATLLSVQSMESVAGCLVVAGLGIGGVSGLVASRPGGAGTAAD